MAKHKCPNCDKTLDTRWGILRHIKKNNCGKNKLSFTCTNKACNKKFLTLKSMIKHHTTCYAHDHNNPTSVDTPPPDSVEAGPSTMGNTPTWMEDQAIIDFLTSIANGEEIDNDFDLLASPPSSPFVNDTGVEPTRPLHKTGLYSPECTDHATYEKLYNTDKVLRMAAAKLAYIAS